MGITYYLKNSFIKHISIGIIINLLLFINAKQILGIFNNKDIVNLFLQVYGNVIIQNKYYILQITFFLINHIYLLYIFGGYINEDLNNFSTYIFTRTSCRKKWLLKKYSNLCIYVSFYYLFQFIFLLLFGFIYGFAITNLTYLIKIIFSEFCLVVLCTCFVILLSNSISLVIDTGMSLLLLLFLELTSLSFCYYIYKFKLSTAIIKYIPFTQGVFMWHDLDMLSNNNLAIFALSVRNFTLSYSFIYLFILISISILIGLKIIENKDFF